MPIDVVLCVIRGHQVGAFQVARRAGEGVIDLGMANQAIRHLWQIGRGGKSRFSHAAMARLAGILGSHVMVRVLMLAKVGAALNRGGNNGRGITHLQVKLVVKAVDSLRGRFLAKPACVHFRSLRTIVTCGARLRLREKPVGRRRARWRRDMAVGASRAGFAEMETVGKGRPRRRHALGPKRKTNKPREPEHPGSPPDDRRAHEIQNRATGDDGRLLPARLSYPW